MNPRYPIFIPTKGRFKNPLTINAFLSKNIPFAAVVEKDEYTQYKSIVGNNQILVLPHQNKGLTATRNWIWDYVQNELKTPYFWTFDDNIRDFYRLNKNMKYRCTSGTFLRVIEDFAMQYVNLYISGMNYEMFVPRKKKHPPISFNTRIYSNMLIKTEIPYRNVTFYNDDTDLCLRILKDGHCTALFNVFLADKVATMQIKGGMTDYYVKTRKRLEFARELQNAHPDVVRIVWKFNRWHHEVNYLPFRGNKLVRDPDYQLPDGPPDYNMKFIKLGNA